MVVVVVDVVQSKQFEKSNIGPPFVLTLKTRPADDFD